MHQKITDCYSGSFYSLKLTCQRDRDKIWVSQGTKKSSNQRMKLYKKWLNSHSCENEIKYKNYLKIFKKVTQTA